MGKRQRIKDSLTLTLVMSKLGGRYNDPLTLTVSKIWGHPRQHIKRSFGYFSWFAPLFYELFHF